MNNPLRALIQKYVEAPRLERTSGTRIFAEKALEIGCGRGVGMEILLDRFNATEVDAFDLDHRMVKLAQKRLVGRRGIGVLWVGDASRIAVPDST